MNWHVEFQSATKDDAKAHLEKLTAEGSVPEAVATAVAAAVDGLPKFAGHIVYVRTNGALSDTEANTVIDVRLSKLV